MSTEAHIRLVTSFFIERKLDYALIGAFALKAYGYTRATADIDFITRRDNQSRIVQYFESIGFETLHKTESFSNHVHAIDALRVDFMYIEGKTADEIFASLVYKPVFADLIVPVPDAEYLLAMKLFSATSNPRRRLKDLSDINALLRHVKIDRTVVEKYVRKYGQEDMLHEILG